MIQSDSVSARGDSGSSLGYGGAAGIRNSIAIEFDCNQQVALGDPAYQHISLHTMFTGQNSASESASLGISASNANLNFLNGSTYLRLFFFLCFFFVCSLSLVGAHGVSAALLQPNTTW